MTHDEAMNLAAKAITLPEIIATAKKLYTAKQLSRGSAEILFHAAGDEIEELDKALIEWITTQQTEP